MKSTILRGEDNQAGLIRAAAYCRTAASTEAENDNMRSQIEAAESYVIYNPQYTLIGTYTDEGASGHKVNRCGGFRSLISDCEAGKIDVILTRDVSRLGRNIVDVNGILRQLENQGIEVIFLENFN